MSSTVEISAARTEPSAVLLVYCIDDSGERMNHDDVEGEDERVQVGLLVP